MVHTRHSFFTYQLLFLLVVHDHKATYGVLIFFCSLEVNFNIYALKFSGSPLTWRVKSNVNLSLREKFMPILRIKVYFVKDSLPWSGTSMCGWTFHFCIHVANNLDMTSILIKYILVWCSFDLLKNTDCHIHWLSHGNCRNWLTPLTGKETFWLSDG